MKCFCCGADACIVYKIVLIKIFKISQFSHHLCALNGKVDTEKNEINAI